VGAEEEWLDLALDVDFSESLTLGYLEDIACLAGEETQFFIFLFEKMLAVVFADERCRIAIGLETKLLCDESQLKIWLVPVVG
jgi:hypothetical protein